MLSLKISQFDDVKLGPESEAIFRRLKLVETVVLDLTQID